MDRRLALEFGSRANVRLPDEARRNDPSYKKGWEVRVPADDEEQLARLSQGLAKHGIKHGKPYAKSRQTVVPIYGRESVEKVLEMLGLG